MQQLCDHLSAFASFLKAYDIYEASPLHTILTYTFLPYDYIDDDLDFDEIEYAKMQNGFQHTLHNILLPNLAAQDQLQSTVTCRQYRMNSQNTPDTLIDEFILTQSPEHPNMIHVTRNYWMRL